MQWPDLSSLQYNPRISVDYTVMSSLPFYQASGFSGTLTDWEQQDIVLLTNIKGPVIIDNEQPENLKYQGEALVPVLVNAIKELKAEVDALKAQINGA